MPSRSPDARLADIAQAVEVIRIEMAGVELEAFETDIRRRWLVERALEIVSETSRRLPESLKARHPHIPWQKVAGLGNVLRHDYERVAPDLIWRLVQDDLSTLAAACLAELPGDIGGPGG